jgi:2'-5' RNA ligase
MRLFIAVCFSDEIRGAAAEAAASAKKQGIRGRYTPLENLHLTLAFLGEMKSAAPVVKALEKLSFSPISMELFGSGSFGRIFYLGIRENPALQDLAVNVRSFLSESGICFDQKAFRPHITLIRDASGFSGKMVSVPPGKMTIRKISLMKSEMGRAGVKYTEIYAFRAGKR